MVCAGPSSDSRLWQMNYHTSMAKHFSFKTFLSVTTGCHVLSECASFPHSYLVGNNIVKEQYDQVLLVCVRLAIFNRWSILIQFCPHH